MNPGWRCPRRIGFLFPHPCDRTSPVGCTDCDDGRLNDPFAQRTDRQGYAHYDDYSRNDFTEADGESLVRPKRGFEEDLTAS